MGLTVTWWILHSEDSKEKTSPFLEILTYLINVALRKGKTITSWRKAIISMIPKRKEDGSFTSHIGEMRPISVLQEFGKISAKLLSDRLGRILLEHPRLLNPAQRAFLKDGCTAQCINTLLNALEDSKRKRRATHPPNSFFSPTTKSRLTIASNRIQFRQVWNGSTFQITLLITFSPIWSPRRAVSRLTMDQQKSLVWKHRYVKATPSHPLSTSL